MEIQKLTENSIKIKGKNASIVVDPSGKTEAEIIIATQPDSLLTLDKVEGQRLIISGPGEYEAGGISVTGKQLKSAMPAGRQGFMYQITEGSKIMLVSSDNISSVPDDEEFDALIVKVISDFKSDLLGPITRKCTVFYGSLNLASIKAENLENASKINLRKTQEVLGKTFLLS